MTTIDEPRIPIPAVKRARKDKTQANAVSVAVASVRNEFETTAEAAERFMPLFDARATRERKQNPVHYTNRKREFHRRIKAELRRSESPPP